jgi:hypothetical protein
MTIALPPFAVGNEVWSQSNIVQLDVFYGRPTRWGSYLIRVVMREPIPYQVLTLNLLAEGAACDFYAAVSPKLTELGLAPKGYWAAHVKADTRHEMLGLDMIPQSDPDSPCGRSYARALWTASRFFRTAFDSWSGSEAAPTLSRPFLIY